jgi:endogenous inhibitor of DNA gyrase (YacG/DUF329 family)
MIDFGSWIEEEYRVPDSNAQINSINRQADLGLSDDEEDNDFKNINL